MSVSQEKREHSVNEKRRCAASSMVTPRTSLETYALQERLRSEHSRQLKLVVREALLAWSASCREENERALAKFQQELQHKSLQNASWDDELKAKLLNIARAVFAGHGEGDPRYMRLLLDALEDERKIWNVNLTEKNAAPLLEEIPDELPVCNDDERIARLVQLLDLAGTRGDGAAVVGGAEV